MISTHAPAGGATSSHEVLSCRRIKFLLTPLREGRRRSPGFSPGALPISTHAPAGGATAPTASAAPPRFHFYSRPCGRGDYIVHHKRALTPISTHAPAGGATARRGRCRRKGQISTHAPAGGATKHDKGLHDFLLLFLLTPLREGRRIPDNLLPMLRDLFLLTPLREGRRCCRSLPRPTAYPFLLTPLREGRRDKWLQNDQRNIYFYSRPCGRGDIGRAGTWQRLRSFLLTPLREGRLVSAGTRLLERSISTHAPAGGATDRLLS